MFILPLGQPVRFLAIEWVEPWEFDHPSVLLEPVERYTNSHSGADGLIEDTAIDLAIDCEQGTDIEAKLSGGDQKEFEWRRWSIKRLLRAARACLAGRKFVQKQYRVTERMLVFTRDHHGEVWFDDLSGTIHG